ncbi:hypothetical protein ACER0C_013619 [Sarotherodon galilaeus]
MGSTEPSESSVMINEDPENEDEQELPELRIVLFGRTTVGKSTLGGIILGDSAAFTSSDPHGERTKTCHVERKTDSDSHSVVVVDTPGLFKMGSSEEDVVKEIKWATENVEPGPHVFLLVERLKIITSEELKALQVFEHTFGKRAVAYVTVVFTHKNDPRGNKADIKEGMKENEHLRELIERSPVQVTELLEKITQERQDYSDFFYTPQMLQAAEKAANEERREDDRRRKASENRLAILEKSGLMGIFLGSVVGYFSCGGELTPTSGALLGALLAVPKPGCDVLCEDALHSACIESPEDLWRDPELPQLS